MNLFYKIRKNARIFAFLYFQMRLYTTYVSYIRFISAYQHFKCIREYDPHFWLSVQYRGFALLGILPLIWNGYIHGLTVTKRDEEG